MYRRGRSGRDRSRDPSRPFSQGRERDRDRDYDRSSRNRDERHSSGHWQDFDRRGEERRRDDRPPHIQSLSSHLSPQLLSGPPSGPSGHQPEQLPNYTRDQSSKGPHARRESRDSSTRDPLPPLDTARRHSGGPASLRKEPPEPSPRERGMIGDPQVHSRRPNTSWPRERDDDRVRGDNRRNSFDRNPDRPSGSPIVESPRSLILPPQSPATSITATPTTTTTPTTAAGAAIMAPSAPVHPAAASSADSKNLSRLFQEACYAYMKYLETQKSYTIAEKERYDHAEHFNTFPAMKDRYEGNASKARKDFALAQESLREKSAPLDQFCRELTKERVSQRDAESAIEFCNQIKKELNSASLTQFIKSNTTPQIQGPSKDEFQQLRNELRDMKRKQEDEETKRQNFVNEFHNYKNEQANRLRLHDKKLERLESFQKDLKSDIDRVKDEHRKTAEELKSAKNLLMTINGSIDKLEKDAGKRGGDILMADAGNDVGALSGRMDEAFKSLENLQKDVMVNHQKLVQTTSICTSVEREIKDLQQKVSTLEVSETARESRKTPREDKVGFPLDYATKADILRLESQILGQDGTIDTLRNGAEADTEKILEVFANLDQKTQNHIQATGEKFQTLEQVTNEQITNLLAMQESIKKQYSVDLKGAGDKFATHFANFHTKFATDVERLDARVGYVESQLEGHILAINHVDQRMNNFTTKDFYERVVQSLVAMNPLLFNYTTQLNNVANEMKAIKETVRILGGQIKQAEQRFNQSPRLAIQEGPNDGPSNGSLKSDRSSEGPSPSFNAVLRDLETHANDIKKLDQRITDHIEMYVTKMNDIKEWTVSATQRLQEVTDHGTTMEDDIKELQSCLNTVYQNSGSPMQATNNSMDRWRAVGNNPDPMQGLPDENGNG